MNGKYSRFFVKPNAFVTEFYESESGAQLTHANDEITIFSDVREGREVGRRKLEEQAQVLVENMDSIISYSQDHQKSKLSILEIILLIVGGITFLPTVLCDLSSAQMIVFSAAGVLDILSSATIMISSEIYRKKKNQKIAREVSQEIGIYKAFDGQEKREMVSKELLADKDGNITRNLSDYGKHIIEESQNVMNDKNTNMCDIFFVDKMAQYCPEDGYKILDAIDRLEAIDEVAEFDSENYPWHDEALNEEDEQTVGKVRRKVKNND